MELDIALAPLGMAFKAGEQIRFIISAKNLFGTWMPGLAEYKTPFAGQHIFHTGGEKASYLQLPLMTR